MAARFGLCFVFLFAVSFAQAFVQNAVHGYPACVACHVAPNGGGLLTDYGRSLSKELMSTWGVSDRFSQPFFGALKNKETVKYGGDVRAIQTWLADDGGEQGSLFPMQSNVEVGVKWDNVMLVGTAGIQQGPEMFEGRGTFLSERHYVLWSPLPTSKLQVGKFRQTFGINDPNHNRLIKRTFGFSWLSEAYNMEFTQLYETQQITVGTSLGRVDNPVRVNNGFQESNEKSVYANYSYFRNENSKIGASLLFGDSEIRRRTLLGVNAVLPVAEKWLLISEVDYERSHSNLFNTDQGIDTVASLVRFGHTPFKGFFWYLLFEHVSRDTGATYSLTTQPGIGVQFLPIPHVNLQIEYGRREVSNAPNGIADVGFALFHFYL
jgi:hypothetical protein